MRPLRIGIVGCGAIGSHLARKIIKDFSPQANLVSIYDIDSSKAERIALELGDRVIAEESLLHLIKRVELVIEASSASASFDIAKDTLAFRRDILIMSVGGIIEKSGLLFELAEKNRCRIFIPSGAVCGIDGLKAARIAGIKSVSLTTRKPADTLKGVPYLSRKGISLDGLKDEKIVFEGTAKEAVKYFPQNVNVAATLSIAGIGAKKTRVRIVAVPGQKTNVHEVEVEAEAGSIFTRTQNTAHPDNPKTSYLAVLSAVETLRGILGRAKVGT